MFNSNITLPIGQQYQGLYYTRDLDGDGVIDPQPGSTSFGFSAFTAAVSGVHQLAGAGRIAPVMPVFEITMTSSETRTIYLPFRRAPGEEGLSEIYLNTFNTGGQVLSGTHFTPLVNHKVSIDDAQSALLFNAGITITNPPPGLSVFGIEMSEVGGPPAPKVRHRFCYVYIYNNSGPATPNATAANTNVRHVCKHLRGAFPAGNDGNDGSAAAPWATIDRGIRSMGANGGILYVHQPNDFIREYFRTSGSGFEQGGIRVEAQQPKDKQIWVLPFPGDAVAIDQGASIVANNFSFSLSGWSGSAPGINSLVGQIYPNGFWFNGASHVNLIDMEVKNCPTNNIAGEALTTNSIYGASGDQYCLLHKMHVHDLYAQPGNGGLQGLVSGINSKNFVLSRCYLHDALNFYGGGSTPWSTANATIAAGVFLEHATNTWIAYCNFDKCTLVYLKYPQATGQLGPHIHHNFYTRGNSARPIIEAGPYAPSAIALWDIHHNVIVPIYTTQLLYINGHGGSAVAHDLDFWANTVVMPTSAGNDVLINQELAGLRAFDNLIVGGSRWMALDSSPNPATTVYTDFNMFSALPLISLEDGGDFVGLTGSGSIATISDSNTQMVFDNPEANSQIWNPDFIGGGDYREETGPSTTGGRLNQGFGAREPVGVAA